MTVEGPRRADLERRLATDGLVAASWSNGPHERFAPHAHAYDKVLVVAAGSIRFGLPDSGHGVDLAIGDRLDLPAETVHDASVGPDGVTCLEAHAPRGTVVSLIRHPNGTW